MARERAHRMAGTAGPAAGQPHAPSHSRPVWVPPARRRGRPSPASPAGSHAILPFPPAIPAVRVGLAAVLVASLAVSAAPVAAWAQAGNADAGKAAYARKCALCHGEKGDGKGPVADLLDPRPRDFTSGIYKIGSTSNKIPSDRDLFTVITKGMPGTSMPPWEVLPEKDRWNLVAYVKTFAPEKFAEKPVAQALPKEVGSSAESIRRGREMFEAIECNKCHGAEGRADGPSVPELQDDWGHPVKPANLTKRWRFRGGGDRAAIAMRLAAGVPGTPMPSFIDSVEKPEDIWHVTNYVASLGPERPSFATLVTVTAAKEAIPDDPNADFWKKLAPSLIPLMGQVIVDPRNFNPSIDLVEVRGAWNDKEIAFHLTWDDPTHSTPDPARSVFADAVSLQFPPKLGEGAERPYFLMGDSSNPVYLLGWEAGKGATEATASGPPSISPIPGSGATAKEAFENGRYRVVLRRPLASGDGARLSFQPGPFIPVAFHARDGGAGETGARMSLTSWYYLRLEEPQSNRRFVVPPLVTLATVVAMLLVVRAAQRRT